MLLILLLSVASAFLDPLEGDVRAAYSALAGGVLGLKILMYQLLLMDEFLDSKAHVTAGIMIHRCATSIYIWATSIGI